MEDIWLLNGASDATAHSDHPTNPAGTVDLIAELTPLDAQTDTTERKAVPDPLFASLFGPIGDAVPATFAILDAAKLPDLPELLLGSGLEHQCLFSGDALEELGHVAPWIIRLEAENSFTRNLFTQTEPPAPWTHWDKDAGIYLRSMASLELLCAHFRKFTKVRMEGVPKGDRAEWQFFRFYDPEQAVLYFDAIRAWPDRMAQFYRLAEGTLVDRIISISSVAATAHVFAPDPATLPEDRPPAFVFQPRDAQIFASARRPRFRKELADWLLRMDPQRYKPFSEEQLYAVVDHGLREGDILHFTFKDEYVYLLYMMSLMGGWVHKSGRMPEVERILKGDGKARRVHLEKAFPPAYAALNGEGSAPFEGWAQLYQRTATYLRGKGGWAEFSPAHARALIEPGLGHLTQDDKDRLAAVLTWVEQDCKKTHGVTSAHSQGIAVLLSYMLGHCFFEDPFYPFAIELVASHATLDDAMLPIGDYAMKRGRKVLSDAKAGAS
ncbi:DUF4123 domain-containing protein [Litoreibacter janthinus]|uniref:DUF4123 domain-containing protein n=1 Tax=Litoreibacter janthinus TaxID=670154 RepID=A0A1I6HMH4_9RHOB|nr:DUF4123 domain-containing protein [Litoreibacter janthinus]SFR55642.1 protein of unknown function [Litoreibacter janthinus]